MDNQKGLIKRLEGTGMDKLVERGTVLGIGGILVFTATAAATTNLQDDKFSPGSRISAVC